MAHSDTVLKPLQLRSSCRERRHWRAVCIEAGAAIKARSNGICWLISNLRVNEHYSDVYFTGNLRFP